MSVRSNSLAGIRKLFRIMRDDVVDVILVNEVTNEYDPRTQQSITTKEEMPAKAMKAVYNEREINNVTIKGDDAKLQFINDDLKGFVIGAETQVWIDDVVHSVVRVKPHLFDIVTHVQVRVT